MRRCFAAIAALVCVVAGGCATPATIKDASTKHGNNLVGLQQAVGEYRRQLEAYYDRLVRQQREAHIAMHVNQTVETMAKDQSDSIAKEILNKPDSQRPAEDFISAGANLADGFVFWGNNFDRWVDKTEGVTLDNRRKTLKDLAAEEEKKAKQLEKEAGELATANKPDDASMKRRQAEKTRKAAETILDEAGRSDDELTYVQVAIELKRQRSILDAQLNQLAAQVTTMQAFHAKINEFLSIDATIDGAKIAEAAAAGSKADITGILGKK